MQLVVLHKAGIAVLNSEQFRYTAITLRPWVKLIGTIDRSDNPQQTVDVTTSLQTSADWPPIQTLEYDLPIAKDGSFQSRVLAPGEIHVTRNIPGDQGVGYMLHVKSIENARARFRSASRDRPHDGGRRQVARFVAGDDGTSHRRLPVDSLESCGWRGQLPDQKSWCKNRV